MFCLITLLHNTSESILRLLFCCRLVLEMSNQKGPAWKHGVEVEMEEQKGYKYIQCKLCDKVLKGGVYRMKKHLAGFQGSVILS